MYKAAKASCLGRFRSNDLVAAGDGSCQEVTNLLTVLGKCIYECLQDLARGVRAHGKKPCTYIQIYVCMCICSVNMDMYVNI